MGINYPIYQKSLKSGKQKYAFEIMRLAKRSARNEPHEKAKKLLYPPKWIRYTLPPVSFGALWYLFATENTERVLAYPIYSMSAYALVVLLAAVPAQVKRCRTAVRLTGWYRKSFPRRLAESI